MTLAIGIDLGGTNLRAAVVDTLSGKLIAAQKVPTPSRAGAQAVIDAMTALAHRVIALSAVQADDIAGVGIGIPGLVDLDRGVALLLPNIPGDWSSISLASIVQQRLHLPVRLINDVRAITLAEWSFGAGRGVDTIACYAIGTGIGGGVIINGRLHLGISGSAGELGHQIVERDGLPCNCGGRGCLEMYACGPAITARGVQAVIQRHPTRIGAMVDYDLNRINVAVILEAAQAGDDIARGIFEQTGAYIGIAVSNTLLTISPRKVIIGGGVAVAGDLLFEPIRRVVRERVFLMPADQVEILGAALGDDAGLIGAAIWAVRI